MAGQLVLARPEWPGAGPGVRRGQHRPGHSGLDRLPGGMDDGPRLPGRIRAAGECHVRVDPAVRAVHRAVLAIAAPAGAPPVAAAPGSADAARLLGLAGVLQPRRDRALGAARLPVPALPASADVGARVRARAPARAAAAARPDDLAGDRSRVPGRLPDRPERDQLERDRRRLRGRDRLAQAVARSAAIWELPAGQRPRRHLRTGQLLRLRPVHGDLRLERHLGSAAGRARRGDRLRSADAGRPVLPRSPDPRAEHGNRAGLHVGLLPVHALRAQLQQQRLARGDAGRAGAAGRQLGAGAGGRGRR